MGTVLLQSVCVVSAGKPDIIGNGTAVSTKEDDIAHFTCKSRGSPRPFLRWKRHGVTIKDADEGVAVLEKSNSTLEESHLFVAVTDNERRGIYICVARNEEGETTMSFKIGEYPLEGLTSTDKAAIGISVGLTLFFVISIAILMKRGSKQIKKSVRRQRARTLSQSSSSQGAEHVALVHSTPNKDSDKEIRNGAPAHHDPDDDGATSLNCTSTV